MKSRINTLQGLRAFAFLQIFILHTGVAGVIPILFSASGAVSFFVILSGFIFGMKSDVMDNRYSVKTHLSIFTNRIKSYYLLHIVALLFIVWLYGRADIAEFVVNNKENILYNALLIQGYVNNESFYFSYNVVAWFLCAINLATILSYPVMLAIKKFVKQYGWKILIVFGVIIYAIQLAWLVVVKVEDANILFWTYVFPPARVVEYILGMMLGYYLKNNYEKIDDKISDKFKLLEIVCVIIFIMAIYIVNQENIVPSWLSYTGFWTPILMFIIFVFVFEKGVVSKMLSSKLAVSAGNISFECLMLHVPILFLFNAVFINCSFTRPGRFLIQLSILAITYVAGIIWHRLFAKKRNH